MRIILTLSAEAGALPPLPLKRRSSSTMRCSRRETVLWRSATDESAAGAICAGQCSRSVRKQPIESARDKGGQEGGRWCCGVGGGDGAWGGC